MTVETTTKGLETTNAELLGFSNETQPSSMWLTNKFFNRPAEASASSEVVIDYIDLGARRSQMSDRYTGKGSNTVDNSGFSRYKFVPPISSERMALLPGDNEIITPGSDPYASAGGNFSLYNRAVTILDNRLERAIEYMAAQILVHGKVTFPKAPITDSYDIGRPAALSPAALSTGKWSAAGTDILGSIMSMRQIATEAGASTPDTLIMGMDVMTYFLENAKIAALLNNRRIDIGEINLELSNSKVIELGRIGTGGSALRVFVYNEYSKSPDSKDGDAIASTDYLIPKNTVILTSSMTQGIVRYAGIVDPKALEDSPMRFIPVARLFDTYVEKSGLIQNLRLQSSFLTIPGTRKNAFSQVVI